MEKKVLGKGLGALISPKASPEQHPGTNMLNPQVITTNRFQPRLRFREDALDELMHSIKENGVLQPIVVRKDQNGGYELIAGERRLRAIKALGKQEIPAIVKDAVTDQEMLEWSIIENIQRDDLNPIEEAKAYESLMQEFGFTQEHVADKVGKKRATVANMLRILTLPDQVKESLFKDEITLGHAKAILSAPEDQQIALCEQIIAEGLSVREAEQRAKKIPAPERRAIAAVPEAQPDQHVARLEEELQHLFGTKVTIAHGAKRGKIQIEYYSLEDLERVLAIFHGNKQ